MFFKSKIYYYLLTAFLILFSIFISVYIYQNRQTVNLIDFTITVSSIVIAVLAFIISLKTYLSIDSVNNITKMEGNLLENENYDISIIYLLKKYNKEDAKSTGKEIIKDLKKRFKKSKTVLMFANNLQHFIDIIIFFAFLNFSEIEDSNENLKEILEIIKEKKNHFHSISSGKDFILIDESVNLINYILQYQNYVKKNDYDFPVSILDIRGAMIKNTVSQTIYYDYLGLYYNKKALKIILNAFELEKIDIFNIKILQKISSNIHILTDKEKEKSIMYLEESLHAFDLAMSFLPNDIMWQGFIKYNMARSSYFLHLIYKKNKNNNKKWINLMDEAIDARYRFNLLLEDLFDETEYLQKSFKYEENLAILVKIIIILAESNQAKYINEDYKEIKKRVQSLEDYNYVKIRRYKNNIIEYLNKKD